MTKINGGSREPVATIAEYEAEQVKRANSTGRQPVVSFTGCGCCRVAGIAGEAVRGRRLHGAYAGCRMTRDSRGGKATSRGVRGQDHR